MFSGTKRQLQRIYDAGPLLRVERAALLCDCREGAVRSAPAPKAKSVVSDGIDAVVIAGEKGTLRRLTEYLIVPLKLAVNGLPNVSCHGFKSLR